MPSAFGSPAAARVGDPVTHSAALSGLLEGALIGAALGAILVASGGTAAPLLIAGMAATGASLGGAVGKYWGEHHEVPCGRILTGAPTVFINDRPAAFVGSLVVCNQHPGPQMIAEGSAMVSITGRPAARVGDHATCGCRVASGSPNVFMGGPQVSPVGYSGEVPWYADAGLFVLGLAGGGALMAVKELGAVAIAAKLGGQLVGSHFGGMGGQYLGGRIFGEGTRGQEVASFAGALVGGVGGDLVAVRSMGGARVPLGAMGPNSVREFNPENAGGPIRTLSTDGVRITHGGVDVVERHIARFPPSVNNAGMIQRLRDVANGDLQPTDWDRNYYTHELREFVRYRRMGWPDGEPPGDAARALWNDTHTATLEDYGLNERDQPLYHPEWRKTEWP